MFIRLLKRSFYNQKKAMALMVVSVTMGTAITASLITLSFEITGKVAKELRAFGANILVEPNVKGLASLSGQQRYLREEDIIKTKTIFWRHNILGVAPFLETKSVIEVKDKNTKIDTIGTWFEKELPLPGEARSFPAGVKTVSLWWDIDGEWPKKNEEVLVGVTAAKLMGISPGAALRINGKDFRASGILNTGGKEDRQIFLNLETLQEMASLKGKISKVLVSALTTPMDDFAYKDPKTMTKTEYEKWYCTGYVTSIAKQVEEVFLGSSVKPIWQVAETEGKVLDRLRSTIYILSILTLFATALGVSTTMISSLLRRIEEIGLMKAIGADSLKISTIFLSEAFVIGISGGLLGYLISIAVVKFIGLKVFGTVLEQKALLLPIAIFSALIIAVIGSLLPIKRALKIKPAIVLKGVE